MLLLFIAAMLPVLLLFMKIKSIKKESRQIKDTQHFESIQENDKQITLG